MSNKSDTYRSVPASSFYAATPAKKRRSHHHYVDTYTPHRSPSRHSLNHYSHSNRKSYNKSPRFTYDRNSPTKHAYLNRIPDSRASCRFERAFSNSNPRKRSYDHQDAFSMPSFGSNQNKSNGDKSPRRNLRINHGPNSRSPDQNSPYKNGHRISNSAYKSSYSSSPPVRRSWPSLNFTKSSPPITLNSPESTPSKVGNVELDRFNAPYSPAKYRRPVTLEQVRSDEENKENKDLREPKEVRKELFRTSTSENSIVRDLEQASTSNGPTSSEALCSSFRYKRDPLEPLPLPNIGNSCYMNSVIQTLFNCPMLMSEIQSASPEISSESSEVTAESKEKRQYLLTKSLIALFQVYYRYRSMDQINHRDMQNPLSKFKQDVGLYDSTFCLSIQQDAVEFLDCVLNSIDEEFEKGQKGPTFSNPISNFLKAAFTTTTVCINCKAVTNTEVEQHSMLLNLPSPELRETQSDWSMQHLIDNYFADEPRKAKCDNCKLEDKIATTRFRRAPKGLLLHLLRHSFDSQKREDKVSVSETIEFPETCFLENTKSQESISNFKAYRLVSVICHHGDTLRSGHYISFNYDCDNQQWYKCDDTSISKTNFINVQAESLKSGYLFLYIDQKCIR